MLGLYCKAYLVSDLRKFPHWSERTSDLLKQLTEEDGEEVEVCRELTDDDYLFLHDTFVVTDGMFSDQHMVFDGVTPEWVQYCRETLDFNPEKEDLPLSEDEAAEYRTALASVCGGSRH